MTKSPEIKDLLRKYFDCRGKITINPSGVVDVTGSVEFMGRRKFTQLPVQFRSVGGYFVCKGEGLTTLAGCPTHVGDTFDCSNNMLTSLEHAPVHVGKHYRCSDNLLTSLEHAPRQMQGYFNCAQNKLTNLMHAPTHVENNFTCHRNPLNSLEGAPEHVGGTWWITYDEHLPLLRMLNAKEIQFMNITPESNQVDDILNAHAGAGKKGSIPCAVALIKAGFKGNARW